MKNNLYYVKRLLQLNCYSSLHYIFLQSNKNIFKEISESYAPYYHFNKLQIDLDYYLNIHIGDGHMCRTGTLFSYLTKSENVSIDPNINKNKMNIWVNEEKPKRFNYIKDNWQNYDLYIDRPYNFFLIHSHIDIVQIDIQYPNWNYIYTNPCCNPYNQIFSVDYMHKNNIKCIFAGYDYNILSERNFIYIYKKGTIK